MGARISNLRDLVKISGFCYLFPTVLRIRAVVSRLWSTITYLIYFMLTIRLSRVGKKKQPSYRLIVSEKARDPWGKFLENLGTYNPRTNPSTSVFNVERINYWISKGAQTSDTVRNLLIDQKIIEGEKVRKVKISIRRKAKIAKKQASA